MYKNLYQIDPGVSCIVQEVPDSTLLEGIGVFDGAVLKVGHAAGVSFTIVNLLLHYTPLVSWSGTATVVSVLLLIAAFLMVSRVKVRGL